MVLHHVLPDTSDKVSVQCFNISNHTSTSKDTSGSQLGSLGMGSAQDAETITDTGVSRHSHEVSTSDS